VDLPRIEPVLCEDYGEVAAGLEVTLPKLVGLKHLGGDLHSHSHETGGHG
jgi:hypothetical protein